VHDYESPTDEGRLIVMLIRARNGWTQDLWNFVARMTADQSHGDLSAPGDLPKRGVLLRAYVDGPFGSSIRARWGAYSTVLIIAGGSGVSFGLSVLQYICMCLSGRDGKSLGGRPGGWGKKSFQTQRVRFVWLIREYGRCDSDNLQSSDVTRTSSHTVVRFYCSPMPILGPVVCIAG